MRRKEGGEVTVQSEARGMQGCLFKQAHYKVFRKSAHMHSKLSLDRFRHQCVSLSFLFRPIHLLAAYRDASRAPMRRSYLKHMRTMFAICLPAKS